MKTISLVLTTLLFLLFVPIFSISYVRPAAVPTCTQTEMPTDLGCFPTDYIGFTQEFYGWGLGLIGFVGVISIMIGGYYIMTSHGNVEYIQRGKSLIFYAIAGILLAVFGFIFIEIIAADILLIPGFGR